MFEVKQSGANEIFSFSFGGPTYFVIGGAGGEPLVSINVKDGAIKYGVNYTPDKAAQQFWAAISAEYRRYLAWRKRQTMVPDAP